MPSSALSQWHSPLEGTGSRGRLAKPEVAGLGKHGGRCSPPEARPVPPITSRKDTEGARLADGIALGTINAYRES
jgi:hypothetical protein